MMSTSSARPVSVSDSSVIEISLLRAVDARAHFGGFALTELAQGDRLVLKRSADAIRFVHPPGYSYFAMLREKLSWGEAAGAGRKTDALPRHPFHLVTTTGPKVFTVVGTPPSMDTVAMPQTLHLTPIQLTAVPVKVNVAMAAVCLEATMVPPLKVPVSAP
jgi:hypothetical protein